MEKWAIVSDYVSRERIEFESKDELLEVLRGLGVNTDVLYDGDGILRTRAYTQDGRIIMEAFHDEFDLDVWLRHPDWLVLAEAVREKEEE